MPDTTSHIGVVVDVPRAFGLFHILCLALLLGIGILLVRALDRASDRKFRRAMLFIWIALVALDLYKQITYDLLHIDGAGNIVFDYYWYAFPFQLCSTPLYVLPFIAFLKDGRARDGLVGFLSFFSFVGGVFVLIMPETCFVDSLFVNIQTMLHHGAQVIISVLLALRYKNRLCLRMYLDSCVVFAIFVSLAIILNVTLNLAFGEAVYGFNMFYIGPYYLELMPALSSITTAVPYPVYLLGYLVLLSLAAYLSYLLLKAVSVRGKGENVAPRVKK